MTKIKCIIVDDEPLARKGMLEYIGHVDFLEVVGVFEDAQQVYPLLIETDVDLVFLDIEMPKISGVDFIRSLKSPPMVIFTTAYPHFALEGYELDAIDYLLKPVALPRFLKAVNKAREVLSTRRSGASGLPESSDYFFVKENGKYVKIFYKDVLYAEALQNYVAIYLPGRKLVTYVTLSILEKQFPSALFLRIHKSYIVSLDKITGIEGNIVSMESARIPVSRKIKDELMQKVIENKLLRR